MKPITLNQNKVTLVDDDVYDFLVKWKWKVCNNYAARKEHLGYSADGKRLSRTIYMHRVICDAKDGLQVDHINGDRLNNQKENLRLVTSRQNNMNAKSRGGSSKYKGVSWNKENKKWVANIKSLNKYLFLGYFQKETDAAIAYNNAANTYHKQYARLNEVTL